MVGDFYGTGIEIWTGFGSIGSTEKKGFEWVIPYVIPCEGYLVAMQFLDLTGGNFFVSSLTLLDGSFQV